MNNIHWQSIWSVLSKIYTHKRPSKTARYDSNEDKWSDFAFNMLVGVNINSNQFIGAISCQVVERWRMLHVIVVLFLFRSFWILFKIDKWLWDFNVSTIDHHQIWMHNQFEIQFLWDIKSLLIRIFVQHAPYDQAPVPHHYEWVTYAHVWY